MTNKTFKPIPGYEGWYSISEDGEVMSYVFHKCRTQALKITPDANGCMTVRLRGRKWYVHHLVLITYHGPKRPGMEARHLDDQPGNNHKDNLRWVPRSKDRKVQGRKPGRKPVHPPETHRKIETLRATGLSYEKVAEAAGVSIGYAYKVANKVTYV
jgi:hypothetical protein